MSKVTVVGAGAVGATCANVMACREVASDVVLIDIKEGLSEGKMLDMYQCSTLMDFDTKLVGATNDYKASANSDVVVITSGIPRKPGMTREELIGTNAKIMKGVIENVIKYSPRAIVIVVANPMDTLTYLALKASGLPKNRIVGMGGATFPTHVKLSVPPGKKAECVIVNGVECEPYLTSDHRTMLEYGEELLVGVTILMKAVGVGKAYIGIENNKPDAIAHLRGLSAGYGGIEIVPLQVKYPQGGEKQLIAAVTGRQVPPPPALPIDVGAVVCNASTTVAVYRAVQKRMPLIERVVTITGKGLREPKNLLTRMGTPVMTLVEAAGGLPDGELKAINGGPMMGRAMVNLGSPVTKGCSGITILSGRDAVRCAPSQCIKCAKCVEACPMGLEPYFLSKMTQKKGWDELEARMITSCIECGSCQATCPAYLPLLDWVRLGKQTVMGLIRARAAAAKK